MNQRLNGCQQTTLDIIRISAALFVLVGHSFSFYQLSILKDQAFFPYIQNIGVVLFFLLSGFLSAYTLTNKNKNHDYCFKEYFIHKVLRVYKEYLPALFLIAIIDAISIFINGERYAYYQAFNIKQFIGNLLMLHNMGPYCILGKVFI